MGEWLEGAWATLSSYSTTEIVWLSVGLFGQAMFSMRFIIQWIVSEKKRDSVVPIAFWYFSLAGATIVLAYGIYKVEPVLIIGQSTGFVIYLRNLYFIHKRKHAELEVANPDGDGMAGEGDGPGQEDSTGASGSPGNSARDRA